MVNETIGVVTILGEFAVFKQLDYALIINYFGKEFLSYCEAGFNRRRLPSFWVA